MLWRRCNGAADSVDISCDPGPLPDPRLGSGPGSASFFGALIAADLGPVGPSVLAGIGTPRLPAVARLRPGPHYAASRGRHPDGDPDAARPHPGARARR